MFNIFKTPNWQSTLSSKLIASAQEVTDKKALAYLVPRKFESLEVWLLMFCGVYGLLVAALVVKGARDIALACVCLVCMAVWRRFNPARNRTSWVLGSMVALAIVCWIYIDPQSGGSSGPYLFMLILMSTAYPLLMETGEAVFFSGCLLALYFFSRYKSGSVPTELFVLRGLLLAGICTLSGRFGAVLRKAEQSIDLLRRDQASLAYNEHGLNRYGARLLEQCRLEVQPCTLVLLVLPQDWHAPLHEGGHSSEYSATRALKLRTRALRDMTLHLTLSMPANSVIARNAQGDWVVLVPWFDRQAVANTLESAFGSPVQLPFGARKDEMFVALTPCLVASDGVNDTVQSMVARAQDIWERAVRTGAVEAAY
jgi:hypothetical protein